MSNKENGETVQGRAGAFVPADLTAKLAGVSLSNVTRVLLALRTISATHGVSVADLADADKVPAALPDLTRSRATEAAYAYTHAAAQKPL